MAWLEVWVNPCPMHKSQNVMAHTSSDVVGSVSGLGLVLVLGLVLLRVGLGYVLWQSRGLGLGPGLGPGLGYVLW